MNDTKYIKHEYLGHLKGETTMNRINRRRLLLAVEHAAHIVAGNMIFTLIDEKVLLEAWVELYTKTKNLLGPEIGKLVTLVTPELQSNKAEFIVECGGHSVTIQFEWVSSSKDEHKPSAGD